MLYSNVRPSGAVTVMVPVATAQVGCITATVVGGVGVAAVSVAATDDTQVISVVLLVLTV